MRLLRRLLSAWLAGWLVTVGAVVAPTLFALLADRATAGVIAGQLFHLTNLATVSLTAAGLLSGSWRAAPAGWPRRLLLAPALLLAVSEWCVHPLLDAEKAANGTHTMAFAAWHGVSSLLYGLATVAAVATLVRELRSA